MTLQEKLKQCRLEKGLSQEQAAERLGVSRQAVAKWENGMSRPSSDNLIRLAALYGTSLDRLAEIKQNGNPILRANLTRIAIIAQAAALNVAIQPIYEGITGGVYIFALVIKYLPLFAASVWMSANIFYEKDPVRRARNARIELLYCLVMLCAALFGYYSGHLFVAACMLIAICLFYILYINPRYMGRQLTAPLKRKKK